MSTAVPGATTAAPLVAVILPVYNAAKTIEETIGSVLGQTFADFELLVINDGSSDASLAIVSRFGDPRVHVHEFDHRGPSACRNRGIRIARSRYVAFIDADDLWKADKLEKQVAALESDPSAGLVYSLTDCIDEHGRYLGPGSHRRESGQVYETLLQSNFLDNGSTPMVRREVFDAAGMFDESLPAAEDWEMWLRIALLRPFACVPEPQVLYRVHAAALSSKLGPLEECCRRVLRAGLDRLPPSPQRDQLERLGLRILYRYLTRRTIATAKGFRTVLPAYRYLWICLKLGGLRWREMAWVAEHLFAALSLTLLPNRIARFLLERARMTVQYLGRGR